MDAAAYFSRPGPRLIDGLELLAHILHPDRVPAAPEGAQALELPSRFRVARSELADFERFGLAGVGVAIEPANAATPITTHPMSARAGGAAVAEAQHGGRDRAPDEAADVPAPGDARHVKLMTRLITISPPRRSA